MAGFAQREERPAHSKQELAHTLITYLQHRPMTISESGRAAPERNKLQELFLAALSTRDEHLIEKRLSQGACPRSAAGSDRDTPLMSAAGSGNLAMVRRLAPLSDLLAVDLWGSNALTHLLWTGATCRAEPDFIECLKMLASSESMKSVNQSGDCPMMVAAGGDSCKFNEVLEALLPWVDWRWRDSEGLNLVSRALCDAAEENALLLWHAHPNKDWVAQDVDLRGRTVAHMAAQCDAPKMLKAISSHVDFNARDEDGSTPLMSANQGGVGTRETMALLAQWSDCAAVDHNGCDALMLVIEGMYEDVPEARRDSFQELVNRADLGAKDKLGETALEKAKDRAFEKAAQIIQERLDISAEREELSQAASAGGGASAAKPVRI